MEHVHFDDLDEIQQNLLKSARMAMERAYAPYSHFYVGASLLTIGGEMISGSNIENAAYGSTICAERAAIARANAEGARQFTKLAIIARGEKGPTAEEPAPCGACRQVINEFARLGKFDIEIIMSNTEMNRIVISNISELLPMSFGPENLKK